MKIVFEILSGIGVQMISSNAQDISKSRHRSLNEDIMLLLAFRQGGFLIFLIFFKAFTIKGL